MDKVVGYDGQFIVLMKACPHPDMSTVSRSRRVISFAPHALILESFVRIWLKYSDELRSKVDCRSVWRRSGREEAEVCI